MTVYELRGTQHPRTSEEHLWITRDGQSIGLEEVASDLESLQKAWHAEMETEAGLRREIERLRDDCQRLWLFIAEQPCDCWDEYGHKRPQECDRCQLLRAAQAGGDDE